MVKMQNNSEQYEALLGSAAEVADACLDMEGGVFFLAWAGELIQNLSVRGYCQSALLTAQKLCEAVGVDWAWSGQDILERVESQRWLNLLAETLMEHIVTVDE